jgi:hypothetical protein
VRRLTAAGAPAGPELRLTRDRTAYEPDVAALGSNLIVAWYEQDETDGFRAMVGSFTPDGRHLWVKRLSSPGYLGRNAIVRTDGQRVAVAWIQEHKGNRVVAVHWLDADGNTAKGRLASFYSNAANPTTWNLNAARNPLGDPSDPAGNMWIVSDSRAFSTRANELVLARRNGAAGADELLHLTEDDGVPSKYPDLAFANDGTLAITWFDGRDGNEEVYLAVAAPGDFQWPLDRRARRVTTTPGASVGAYLAWNGDRLGLAWCDNTGGQHEIYFQSFDKTGAPLGETQQITHTPADSLIPSIHPFGDGFGLLWNEFIAGPGGGHDPRSRSEIAFARVFP